MQYFNDPGLGQSQFMDNTMWISPQLQLWHLHWLVLVQSLGDVHSQVPQMSQSNFMSHTDTGVIFKTH